MKDLKMIKNAICALAISFTTACMGSGGSDGSGPSANPFVVPTPAAMAADMTHVTSNQSFGVLLNGVRLSNSASAVTYDARLGAAAQGHANDMLANDFFSHTGSNGSNVGDRVSAQGYNWSTVGENIARGYPDEGSVLTGWVNSPDHQTNNVNPNFEDFALAKAGMGSDQYWVLVLATEQ